MKKRVSHASTNTGDDPLRDASRGVRIQKVLAAAGIDSRRRCEELIADGAVTVNGRIVDSLPAWVDPSEDEIVVEGRRLPKAERKVYVMLNKPRRCVTTTDDPDGRRTVVDLVDHPLVRRLFPVGRLDFDTAGLLLLTNDGELANQLTHPRYGVKKTYRVKVRGQLVQDDFDRMAKGMFLADRQDGKTVGAQRLEAAEIELVRGDREKTTLEITLKEGRNRQIRRMLAHLGRPVVRLERIRMGPLKLKGLRRGEWRELSREELGMLRAAVEQPAKASAKRSAPAGAKTRRKSR